MHFKFFWNCCLKLRFPFQSWSGQCLWDCFHITDEQEGLKWTFSSKTVIVGKFPTCSINYYWVTVSEWVLGAFICNITNIWINHNLFHSEYVSLCKINRSVTLLESECFISAFPCILIQYDVLNLFVGYCTNQLSENLYLRKTAVPVYIKYWTQCKCVHWMKYMKCI